MLFKWQGKKHKMSKNANEAYKLVLIHFWNLKSPDGAAVQKYQKQILKQWYLHNWHGESVVSKNLEDQIKDHSGELER